MTANQVFEILKSKGFYPSQVSKNKKGNFVYRKGFFYTNGNSAGKIADSLLDTFKTIEVVSTQDIWKPFRGGDSVANSSHFMVEFKMHSVNLD